MISIICGIRFDDASNKIDNFSGSKYFENLLNNDHLENICEHSSLFNGFISYLKELNLQDDDDDKSTFELLKDFLKDAIKNSDDTNELVSLAISCLQAFVKINWLGPIPIEMANIPSLLRKDLPKEISINDRAFNLREHFKDDKKVFQKMF